MDTVMFVFWLVAAIVLAVAEALTTAMITIWFMFGAILAMLGAVFGIPYIWQVVLFVAGSIILLVVTRPFAKRMLHKDAQPTNSDRIIGHLGVVIEEINDMQNTGQIKVLGQIWSARTEDGEIVEKGESVRVNAIVGVKAVVKRAKAEE